MSERHQIFAEIDKMADAYEEPTPESLSFWKMTQVNFDRTGLDIRYPHLTRVVDYLEREAALSGLGDGFSLSSPLLLVGPPGCGKSDLALRFADQSGLHSDLIDASVTSAGWQLTGLDRSWRGAKQGKIAGLMLKHFTLNPLLVIDEIDKATGSSQAPFQEALGGLLEPLTASIFKDEFLNSEFDVSKASFIMTANCTDSIQDHILDRCHVIECRQPDFRERCQIIRNAWTGIVESESWGYAFNSILLDDVLFILAEADRSIRSTLRLVKSAAGVAVIQSGSKSGITITTDYVMKAQGDYVQKQVGFIH